MLSILGFASMTPFGMGLGLYFSLQGDTIAAIFTALAAGSFIYVAIVEILMRELGNKVDRCHKLLALAAGYAVMSVLAIWV